MALPGMPRHREAGPEEAQGVADAKVPIEEHLRRLGVVDETGKGRQRAIAISNRNLGTNHGHVVRADIEWATYGQKVLRHGSVARVDDLIDEVYEAPPRSHSC
jgi:hypothetical protein